MKCRPVSFTSDGLELVGELYVPDRDLPYPTVVLTTWLHHFGERGSHRSAAAAEPSAKGRA